MIAAAVEVDFEARLVVERRAAVALYAEAEAAFMNALDQPAAVRLLAARDELERRLDYPLVLSVLDEFDEGVLDLADLEPRVERSLALAERVVAS